VFLKAILRPKSKLWHALVAECDVPLAEDVMFDVVRIPGFVSSNGGRMVWSRHTLPYAIYNDQVILVLHETLVKKIGNG
jgi:hypothetical protein